MCKRRLETSWGRSFRGTGFMLFGEKSSLLRFARATTRMPFLPLTALRAEDNWPFPPSISMRSGYGHSACLRRLDISSSIMAKSFGLPVMWILNLRYHSFAGFPLIKVTMDPVDCLPWMFEMSYASILVYSDQGFGKRFPLTSLKHGSCSQTGDEWAATFSRENTWSRISAALSKFCSALASVIDLLRFLSTEILRPLRTAARFLISRSYVFTSGLVPGHKPMWQYGQGSRGCFLAV